MFYGMNGGKASSETVYLLLRFSTSKARRVATRPRKISGTSRHQERCRVLGRRWPGSSSRSSVSRRPGTGMPTLAGGLDWRRTLKDSVSTATL